MKLIVRGLNINFGVAFCGFVVLWTLISMSCHNFLKKIRVFFFGLCNIIIFLEVHKTTKPQNKEMKLMVKQKVKPKVALLKDYNGTLIIYAVPLLFYPLVVLGYLQGLIR